MKDYFSIAFATTIRYEGGFSNDPYDAGGQTKYGISQKQYPTLDIRSLTIFEAKEIYRRDYWLRFRCDELPGPLSVCFFDAVVNHSPKNPIKWLQKVVRAKADGVLGDETIRLARSETLDIPWAARDFTIARLEYVKTLSIFWRFGQGWHARHVGVLTEALRVP